MDSIASLSHPTNTFNKHSFKRSLVNKQHEVVQMAQEDRIRSHCREDSTEGRMDEAGAEKGEE